MVKVGRRTFINIPGGSLRRSRTKIGGPKTERGGREAKRCPSDSRRERNRVPKVIVEFPEDNQSTQILGINVNKVVHGHLAFASFEGTGDKFRGVIVPERNNKVMVSAKQLAAA